jgi:hypothetical protein
MAGLTDAEIASMTEPVTEPGYPEPESFPVRECLRNVLNKEWEHRLYAERDFDILEHRGGSPRSAFGRRGFYPTTSIRCRT